MENFSLSDLATAVRGSDGNGIAGGDFLILILLFVMLSGGNLFGNRSSGLGDYATAASQQDILFSSKFSDLDNKIDRLGNGIADATFSLNNSITTEGRNIQMQLAQVNSNIDNKFAALEKSQLEQTIRNLEGQVSSLNLQNSLCGVMRYPTNSAYAYSLPVASVILFALPILSSVINERDNPISLHILPPDIPLLSHISCKVLYKSSINIYPLLYIVTNFSILNTINLTCIKRSTIITSVKYKSVYKSSIRN